MLFSGLVLFFLFSFIGMMFIGLVMYFLIVAIIIYKEKTSEIPDDYWKRKKLMRFANTFYQIFFLSAITLTLSWSVEIAMENVDFAGMQDNMNLILTAAIGGLWGFGMSELYHETKENENKSPKIVLSESFKQHLEKLFKYIFYILIWFFIIISLIRYF